jgi:Transglutaminase-like superfamily
MKRIVKFLLLPSAEKLIFLKAVALLILTRLGLSLLSFQTFLRLHRRLIHKPTGAQAHDAPSSEKLIWAVETASRYVPNCACLARALTAQVLLRWYGHKGDLRIGVAKGESGILKAHAWVGERRAYSDRGDRRSFRVHTAAGIEDMNGKWHTVHGARCRVQGKSFKRLIGNEGEKLT